MALQASFVVQQFVFRISNQGLSLFHFRLLLTPPPEDPQDQVWLDGVVMADSCLPDPNKPLARAIFTDGARCGPGSTSGIEGDYISGWFGLTGGGEVTLTNPE